MTRKIRYPVGCRVIDRKTKERGTVVHVFRDPTLADVRVVRFGAANEGLAVPLSLIGQYRTAPIAQRRRSRIVPHRR
jgi:hypothetical protein